MSVFLHNIHNKAILNFILLIVKKILPNWFVLGPLKDRYLFWVHDFSKILSNVFKIQMLNYQFGSDAFFFKRISLTATAIPVYILSWWVLMPECQFVLKKWGKTHVTKTVNLHFKYNLQEDCQVLFIEEGNWKKVLKAIEESIENK